MGAISRGQASYVGKTREPYLGANYVWVGVLHFKPVMGAGLKGCFCLAEVASLA